MSSDERRYGVREEGGVGTGIFGLECTEEQAAVVLVPVPFEATASYGMGASKGPESILRASDQVELFDLQTGHPCRAGIVMLPESEEIRAWNREARALAEPVIEAGGTEADNLELCSMAEQVDAIGARVNERVRDEVVALVRAGKVVGVVGGDHSVSYGAIQAHASACPGLGILHVDAHADLRAAYQGFEWSHASIMANVTMKVPQVSRLVQVGVRDLCEEEFERVKSSGGRIISHFDTVLRSRRFEGASWRRLVREIVGDLPGSVYVSFDIDGLEPSCCPHTGTPVPGGLSFSEAAALLEEVVASGRTIVGFDLTEVAPGPGGDQWDGNVGARVLYKLIGFALLSRGLGEAPILQEAVAAASGK